MSFPFVPGHEVVGELDDGARVVLEPVLGHAAHGFEPPFADAAPGDGDDYGHLDRRRRSAPASRPASAAPPAAAGRPSSSPTTASSTASTPAMPDERAVLVEPLAGGIHAALLAAAGAVGAGRRRPVVAVLGAGTMGLAAVAGLVRYVPAARVVVGARYPHQQAAARALGAHDVVPADELVRAVRRLDGCRLIGDSLSRGAHAVIDAVGSEPPR